jgi:thiamine pyrophosphokinase
MGKDRCPRGQRFVVGGIMRVVIIGNRPMVRHPRYQHLVGEKDLVLCVDGGANNALALGFEPQVVIGDMDSIEMSVRERLQQAGCRFVEYPSRKDETDSELAVRYALSQGATELVMLGALGGRVDHTLANVMLLTLPELEGVKARLVEGDQEVFLIRNEVVIEGQPGDTLSLLPLSGDAVGIYTEGLEYPLHNGTLKFGAARGVSNVLTASQARVRVGRGLLLAVHHLTPPSRHDRAESDGGDDG